MDILPIQGTSVPCECIFSSAKETNTVRRSSMSAHLMEALQFLKFALKKRGSLNFTEGLSNEDQLKRESLTHDEFHIPAYMKSFLDRHT